MAIIWYEHFDSYGTNNNLLARGYTIENFTPGLDTARVRTGTTAFRIQQGSGSRGIRYFTTTPLTTIGQGAALQCSGAPGTASQQAGLRFSTGATTDLIRVNMNSSLGISVFQNTTLLGSSSPSLVNLNSWFWLEARVISGPGTIGSVVVRLNGLEIINLTGLSLTGQWTSFGLCSNNVAGNSDVWFDDWIVWDDSDTINNNFIGDTFVFVAPPTGDGTPNQWTPNSGTTNWTQIDELTPNSTDFIIANNVGDANEFSHQVLNLPVGAVTAIATQARAYKTDSGSSSVAVGLASGNSITMSPERALATGVAVVSHIANRNPEGNVPWTQSSANSSRMRFERLA